MRDGNLIQQVSIQEVEALHQEPLPADSIHDLRNEMSEFLAAPQIDAVLSHGITSGQLPFGRRYARWHLIKNDFQPGDELWAFESQVGSRKATGGVKGYLLLRDGKVVNSILTELD